MCHTARHCQSKCSMDVSRVTVPRVETKEKTSQNGGLGAQPRVRRSDACETALSERVRISTTTVRKEIRAVYLEQPEDRRFRCLPNVNDGL